MKLLRVFIFSKSDSEIFYFFFKRLNINFKFFGNLFIFANYFCNKLKLIISDFMEDISHIEAAVRRFSENDLLLIQILDPFETELDMTGDARFHDMETEIEFKTYVSESFKKGYHEALNEHIENINAVCGRAGAGFYTFTTDTPIFDAFLTAVGRRL